MDSAVATSQIMIGDWRFEPALRTLTRADETVALEPKTADLLTLLASKPGEVFTRDQLFDAIWQGVTVGEDTLARAIMKLRKALSDDAKQARYIETIPKAGYRLIAPVSPVGVPRRRKRNRSFALLVGALVVGIVGTGALLVTQQPQPSSADQPLERADDLYSRFTRTDNEAAISLYEEVLTRQPESAAAHAGLANSLVQRTFRWPQGTTGAASVQDAHQSGLIDTPQATRTLARAEELALRAVRLAPNDGGALKALGLVYSAQGRFDEAIETYQQALEADERDWRVLINLSEAYNMTGEPDIALETLERAYSGMMAAYEDEPQRVADWPGDIAVLIGDYHLEDGERDDAALWYRRALTHRPFDDEATSRLVNVLSETGDADAICAEYEARIGELPACN